VIDLPARIPLSDDFGHFWLGPDKATCPAILKAGTSKPHGLAPENACGFFASTGCEGPGVLFDHDRIRYFKTPKLAFEALKEVAAE
jgi:hypothetical protein